MLPRFELEFIPHRSNGFLYPNDVSIQFGKFDNSTLTTPPQTYQDTIPI